MLNKEDAFQLLITKDKNGYNVKTYHFHCTTAGCSGILKVQTGGLKLRDSTCCACKKRKKPFEALYNLFKFNANRRNQEFNIIYNDFIELMKEVKCHYCHDVILRHPYTRENYKYTRSGLNYQLDRKDNNLGYIKNNLVSCCWKCNNSKSSHYSHDEWYIMNDYWRKLHG